MNERTAAILCHTRLALHLPIHRQGKRKTFLSIYCLFLWPCQNKIISSLLLSGYQFTTYSINHTQRDKKFLEVGLSFSGVGDLYKSYKIFIWIF